MTRTARYPKPVPKCWCEYADLGEGVSRKVQEAPGCPACGVPGDPGLDPDRVLFAGDTHGDANHVRYLLQVAQRERAQAVFVLGDFGIWDHLDGGRFTDSVAKFTEHYGIPVLFLPGNHDNYDLLFQYEAEKPRCEDGFVWLRRGVGYSPRGHRWTWKGLHFMSLGGAYSIDKPHRISADHAALLRAERKRDRGSKLTARERYLLRTGQESWWAQEEISQEELDYALRPGKVDILLTHDKPRASTPDWDRKDLPECWENQEAIQEVVDAKAPRLLLHGHLHYAYGQTLGATTVRGLDCDPEASRYSGGSGNKDLCAALLTLYPPDAPHERGFRLEWRTETRSEDLTVLLDSREG